jgi:hypothetical protein
MRLSQVVGGTSTVEVSVGPEKLPVTYQVGAFTPALEDELNQLAGGQGERPGREFCELLSKVVCSWELDEDDGSPVGTTADRMMDLPAKFLSDTLLAISEDMRPGEADGPSAGGSPRAANSGPNPTGIDSSPQLAGLESPPGISLARA